MNNEMSPAPQEQAVSNRADIIQNRGEIQQRFLLLGGLLKECRDKELWKVLGYESFAAFLGDPEITFKRSTAYGLIRIYEVYSGQMGLPSDQLARIGTRKLQIILPVVQTDPDRWLGEAESLSKSDLINTVRESQGKEPVFFDKDDFPPNPEQCIDYKSPEKYLGMVKASPCCVCGRGPSDSAHFPKTVGAGAGPGDVIPLCRACHDEQHRTGVDTFHAKYKNNIWSWVYSILHRGYRV